MHTNIMSMFCIASAASLVAFSMQGMDDQSWLPCNQTPATDCPSPTTPQQTTLTLPVPRPMSPGALTRKVLELEQQNRTYQFALQEQAVLIREQVVLIQEQSARIRGQEERTAGHARSIAELPSIAEQLRALQDSIAAHGSNIAMLTALPEKLRTLQDQIAGQLATVQQGVAAQGQSLAGYTQQLSILQGQVATHGSSIAVLAPQTRVTELEQRLQADQLRLQEYIASTNEHIHWLLTVSHHH